MRTVLPLLLLSASLHAAPRLTASQLNTAAALRTQALADETAWQVVSGLSTEIGQRLAGSPNDLKSRDWVIARMRALGFDKVYTEPVSYPVWERGFQSAHVVAPEQRALNVAALGGSMGTPAGGIRARVVRFETLDALNAAADTDVAGQIVYIDLSMARARDGRGYGPVSNVRVNGASAAARKGAVAFLLRSAGTDLQSQSPHTGMMRYESTPTRIPAAALATGDADALTALLAGGNPVELKLELGARTRGTPYVGANVVGEITGRERPDEVVVIGGHLDSWDLGTGAIDDGAGVAITMAAGTLIGQLPQPPRRTIRVVAFANEEQGVYGGKAYGAARIADHSTGRHFVAAESDFGAGRIYGVDTGFGASGKGLAFADQLLPLLSSLGVVRGGAAASGGADVGALREAGVPVASLKQDGTYYFDIHHTARDTLDQIDPDALKQNVAVWTVFAYLAAEFPGDLR